MPGRLDSRGPATLSTRGRASSRNARTWATAASGGLEPHHPQRLAVPAAELDRQARPAGRLADAEDERRVRADDVELRPRWIIHDGALRDGIELGDAPVLGEAAQRDVAAARDPERERRVEGRPVHPGLAAGDYPSGQRHRHS